MSDNQMGIRPNLKISVVNPEEIHEATLEVLAETGVIFPSEKALNILAEAGAEVDFDTMIAKIPPKLVEQALRTAPREFVLAGREPESDLLLDGETCYLSTDGCGVEVIDIETGERRGSTKQDVADSARVADALDEISFYWGPAASALDVPSPVRSLHELQAALYNTVKHVQPETILGEQEARYAIKMAEAVAGGSDELRKRPVLSIMQCAKDPLGHDGGSLEASLVAAEHGIPTGFMPMPMGCATAPATLAANLVITTADSLSTLVLLQLAHPGSPYFFAAAPTSMDLHTGGYTGGGPEDHLLAAGFKEVCAYYGIPLSMGVMATGSKEPDWHAALDNSLSTLMSVLTHTDMLTGAGLLHGSKIFAFDQLVMDCEIMEVISKTCEGIHVDEETLAFDVISKVGPGSHFLAEKHTRNHMRDLWQPRLVDQASYDAWEKSGRRGPMDRALDMAREIHRQHEVPALDDEVQAEIDALLADAEKHLGRS